MEGNPLVSVIITTCNGDYKLVRAVDSVLMQTYNNIEIIVVDDNGNGTASRIETEKMMEKFSNTDAIPESELQRENMSPFWMMMMFLKKHV